VNKFCAISHDGGENAALDAPLVSIEETGIPAGHSTLSPPAKTEADSDHTLVERLRAGDQSAFKMIFARLQPRIYSMTYRMLGNREDAEEVTQDAFIRALRGLAAFRGDAALSTWITRIALNLAHNRRWYWLRRKRDETVSIDAPLGDASWATHGDAVAAGNGSTYDQLAVDELLARVREGMTHLSSSHREILTLRTVRNLSYRDIAKKLDISIGTVKSRIVRAREDLRSWSSIGAET
jgi:RNA polymerase sigma-70 factor (ECF subfamily)